MSPRTGRPPKENPRNCKLNIRLTRDELNMIEELAIRLSLSRTDAILTAVKASLGSYGEED